MPASEAQIVANRLNAVRSAGPKTSEGKAISRSNALKHGMTGEGIVVQNEDAAEVGKIYLRRAAMTSVRMDRAVEQEAAALSGRVRRAFEAFQAPEGVGPEEAARLRHEAERGAMFDPSAEATLAPKNESAAERRFNRAFKELRRVAGEARAAAPGVDGEFFEWALASFVQFDQQAVGQPPWEP